jgi:PAS domain S-box-containing protein
MPADEDEAVRRHKRVMNWLLAAVFSCVFALSLLARLRRMDAPEPWGGLTAAWLEVRSPEIALLFLGVPLGVPLVQPGLVNEWNNKAVDITRFTRKEVVGRDLVQESITEEHREEVRAVLDDALRGNETGNLKFALYTNVENLDVLLNSTTQRDLSGGVSDVVGVGQDIPERNISEMAAQYFEMVKTRVAKSFIDTAKAPIFGPWPSQKRQVRDTWRFETAAKTIPVLSEYPALFSPFAESVWQFHTCTIVKMY